MYQISIGEKTYKLEPNKDNPNSGKIDSVDYSLDIAGTSTELNILHDLKSYNVSLVHADYETHTFTLRVNNTEYTLEAKDQFEILLAELGMDNLVGSKVNDLKAPMPGLVLKVLVKEGESVSKGQPLVVLEAMKMENMLKAESDAIVKSVHAEIGKAVEKNEVLLAFEA
jgi:acetyl/propionyl-CoA carboxylase alpha subunit